MSVGVESLPPWKQALIEKRRRQEEEDKKRSEDEQARLSVMPVWKREIILRKKQQKNSLIFLGKRSSGNDVNGLHKRQELSEGVVAVETNITDEDVDSPEDLLTKVVLNHKRPDEDQVSLQGPIEEHVKPIQQNPWFVTDTLRKKKKQRPRQYSNDGGGNYRVGTLTNHVICDGETDGRYLNDQTGDNTNDSVFGEDLPEYGRGFVHKLRRKFTTLSASNQQRSPGEKQRSQSSDSLLDDSLKVSPRGGPYLHDEYAFQSTLYASPKAHSMESLLGDPPAPVGSPRRRAQERIQAQLSYEDGYSSPRRGSLEMPPQEITSPGLENLDDLPRPNTVSAARSIFESPVSTDRRGKPESPRNSSYDSDNYEHLQNGSAGNSTVYNSSIKPAPVQEDTLKNIRDVGKVVYSTEYTESRDSQGDNDRNANYRSTEVEVVAAGGQLGYNNRGTAGSRVSPTGPGTRYNNEVHHKNQNNNLLSSRHVNGSPSEVISTDPDRADTSPVSPGGYFSKKRPAPQPPQYISPEDTKKHAVEDSNKMKLTLDLQNSKEQSPVFDESPSYRDLYFSGRSSHRDGTSPRKETVSSPRDNPKLSPEVSTAISNSNTVNSSSQITSSYSSSPSYSSSHSSQHTVNAPSKPTRTAFTGEPSRKLSPAEDVPSYTPRAVRYDAVRHIQNEAVRNIQNMDTQDAGSESSSSVSSHDNLSNGWSSSSMTSVTSVDSPKRDPPKSTATVSKTDDKPKPAVTDNKPTVRYSPESKQTVTLRQSPPHHDVTKRYTVPQATSKESTKVERPNSIISNSGMSLADITKVKNDDAKKLDKKVTKRNTGPGSLLIRPASNLLPAGATNSVPYLNLNQYKDITTGVFAEAPKKIYDTDSDDEIPVTNIDDVLSDDVPVTSIDDYPIYSSNKEVDADTMRKTSKKYEFIGGGVSLGRSLLEKTKAGRMRIQFNDAATSTYEYPSEQSMLEQLSPEERLEIERENASSSSSPEDGASDGEEPDMLTAGTLKSNPAIGAAGNLATYQSKFTPDYALGMNAPEEEPKVSRPETQREQNSEDVLLKPADEDDTSTWSNSTTSDLLF